MLNRLLGQVPNASEHGYLVDNMLEFCHWFMLALFVGWSTFLVITLVRFRRSRNPKANYHGVKSKASTHLEFMVVLVEAVLLLGFGVRLWAQRVNDFPKEDAVTVRVMAEQFAWNFQYPGKDGVFGKQDVSLVSPSNPFGLDRRDPAAKDDITVLNEMHLPVNRNTVLQISSKDVIHSFSVQAMRVGQDCIPGSMIPHWFKPISTGTFEIICGQLCGLSHYNMRGVMVVDSATDYDAWLAEMGQLNAAP